MGTKMKFQKISLASLLLFSGIANAQKPAEAFEIIYKPTKKLLGIETDNLLNLGFIDARNSKVAAAVAGKVLSETKSSSISVRRSTDAPLVAAATPVFVSTYTVGESKESFWRAVEAAKSQMRNTADTVIVFVADYSKSDELVLELGEDFKKLKKAFKGKEFVFIPMKDVESLFNANDGDNGFGECVACSRNEKGDETKTVIRKKVVQPKKVEGYPLKKDVVKIEEVKVETVTESVDPKIVSNEVVKSNDSIKVVPEVVPVKSSVTESTGSKPNVYVPYDFDQHQKSIEELKNHKLNEHQKNMADLKKRQEQAIDQEHKASVEKINTDYNRAIMKDKSAVVKAIKARDEQLKKARLIKKQKRDLLENTLNDMHAKFVEGNLNWKIEE